MINYKTALLFTALIGTAAIGTTTVQAAAMQTVKVAATDKKESVKTEMKEDKAEAAKKTDAIEDKAEAKVKHAHHKMKEKI